MQMSLAERIGRKLRGEPVCEFDWPSVVPFSRKLCDGVPFGKRDGRHACAAHLVPYVPTENRPYDDDVEDR